MSSIHQEAEQRGRLGAAPRRRRGRGNAADVAGGVGNGEFIAAPAAAFGLQWWRNRGEVGGNDGGHGCSPVQRAKERESQGRGKRRTESTGRKGEWGRRSSAGHCCRRRAFGREALVLLVGSAVGQRGGRCSGTRGARRRRETRPSAPARVRGWIERRWWWLTRWILDRLDESDKTRGRGRPSGWIGRDPEG
uniref:Uncharacterized protein n=1 Tax=Triticum urartu TaxID=4572 RepID=A0A8R7QED4_TRIUA